MSSSPPVKKIRFGSYDTRRNLPAASSRKRGESNFLCAFEKVWMEQEVRSVSPDRTSLAAGREFGLEGFGRADLVFVAWRHVASSDSTALSIKPPVQITAIEAKISDWRKGLMQASRYRFFANRTLLVLPPGVAAVAARFLPTFRTLNVGLWEFDSISLKLTKHFTPRAGKPLNKKVREKAVHIIGQKLKFR